MKIFKNSASIEITLEDFLEILEEDALDDILFLLIDLDKSGSIKADYDGDFINMMDGDLEPNDTDKLFGSYTFDEKDMDFFFDFPEEALNDLFFGDEEADLLDELLLSNEDLRVKGIVQRFQRITESPS